MLIQSCMQTHGTCSSILWDSLHGFLGIWGIRYGLIGDPDMNSGGTHPTAKFMFNIVFSNCVDTFIVDLKIVKLKTDGWHQQKTAFTCFKYHKRDF